MIKEDLEVLRGLLDNSKNTNWRHKKSFDKVVNHCISLEENFTEKTHYLEKMIALFFCKELEKDMLSDKSNMYPDKTWIEKFVFWKLNLVLRSSVDDILLDFENNIQVLNIENKYPLEKQGDITKVFKRIIRDYIILETKK